MTVINITVGYVYKKKYCSKSYPKRQLLHIVSFRSKNLSIFGPPSHKKITNF